MSGLTREQRGELSADDFADPVNRTMPLADDIDVKRAVFRSNTLSEPRRGEVRRRIVEVALRKGLRIPPSLGVEAIGREINDYQARHGASDSTGAAGGNTLRFTVRNEEDLTRACEATRQQLKEKGESMSTNFQQRHDTDAGRLVLQRIHDETARAGAVCVAPKNLSSSAEFISKHESAKLQEIHDICLQGGAKCAERGSSSPYFSNTRPTERDPKERAREYAERRNRQIRGEGGGATPQAELSEPAPSTDPMEAARERARTAARRHVEKRNRQIEQEKKDIRDGKRPFHWRGR